MDSKELIMAGNLSEARRQLIEDVKSSPSDMGKRTLLFQVHTLLGEWDKAERQLDVIATQDSSRETGVQVYKNLIQAERERMEVLKTNRRPSFLPETPPYLELYSVACEKLNSKKTDEAIEIFDKINSQLPVLSGTINGKYFSGFNDIDISLTFFLEAIVHERYIRIPFESLREVSITPPKSLFDLIWIPAHITTWNELTISCYLPVLYPGSFLHEDDRVKLGRMTDWVPAGGPFSKGMGQHVFLIGEEEVGILDIREVVFNKPDTGEEDEKAD